MRGSKILNAINWRHAIGELLLIVVGILIALQASDWQNRRVDRQTEIAYLEEIRTSLSTDIDAVTAGIDRYRQIEMRIMELLSRLDSELPYEDSVDTYFGAVYGANAFSLNAAAYESLKSHGLTLISDRTLRSEIAMMYELTYPDTQRAIRYEESTVLDILRPYFLLHFRDLTFDKSATPIDYDFVANDTKFLNLANYRLQLVRQNQIPTFERAAAEMEKLIQALELELYE